MLAAVAAFALTVPGSVEIPRLPAIQREAQITYVDKAGAVIGVRGGRYAPPVDLARLPKHVGAAVVSIEDRRYYEHGGVDYPGIVRAAIDNVQSLSLIHI